VYWTAIHADLATRLWRALGRHGARLSWMTYRSCRTQCAPYSISRYPHSRAGAGTPEEASAWRWLRVHGAAVRSIDDLTVFDVEPLSILQLALPALEKIRG